MSGERESIIHGDCRAVVPTLADESVSAVIIDPPYGEGFDFNGDESEQAAGALLREFLRVVTPKMRRMSHAAIFWPLRTLDVCIDSIRESGLTYCRTVPMYLPNGSARPYLSWLPRVQGIVIAKRRLPTTPNELHAKFAPWLKARIERSKLSRSAIARSIGCNSRLVTKWCRADDPAWCLPTPRFYRPLKKLLKLEDDFDIFLTDRPRPSRSHRTEFEYQHDIYIVDEKRQEPRIHPTQKPLSVLRHLVHTLTLPGELVVDGFAGSGTTAVAALELERRFLCIERDERYHELAVQRLAVRRGSC